jgi:hypothetical protein
MLTPTMNLDIYIKPEFRTRRTLGNALTKRAEEPKLMMKTIKNQKRKESH